MRFCTRRGDIGIWSRGRVRMENINGGSVNGVSLITSASALFRGH